MKGKTAVVFEVLAVLVAALLLLLLLLLLLVVVCLAIAIPNIPLSILLATGTFRTGFGSICPFTILSTAPAFFSKAKMSFGPRNAILDGDSRSPLKTVSILRLELFTIILGPSPC